MTRPLTDTDGDTGWDRIDPTTPVPQFSDDDTADLAEWPEARIDFEAMASEFVRLGVPLLPPRSSENGGGDGTGRRPPEGPSPGDDPVPHYRLQSRLGAGGAGEVWRAVGPGGVSLALKFIRVGAQEGLLEDRSDASIRALRRRSLRSLELTRDVRHANLLPIYGAWLSGDLLIIAMELADGTLMDRCNAAVARGMPGIPFPELIEAMRQAARGIDFLNGPRPDPDGREGLGVQHRDIKPENLLEACGVVKVGDFGLAKLLDDAHSQTHSMTPAYAAPELFHGQLSRWSDQYSLAVTYCRLRGGRPPYTGSHVQVMIGHLHEEPDLSMIPVAERPAVLRALSKPPEDRWPDCRAFVEAIAEGAAADLGLESVASDPVRIPDGSRSTSAVRAALALLTISAVALAAAGFWAFREAGPVDGRDGPPLGAIGSPTAADPGPPVAEPPPPIRERPEEIAPALEESPPEDRQIARVDAMIGPEVGPAFPEGLPEPEVGVLAETVEEPRAEGGVEAVTFNRLRLARDLFGFAIDRLQANAGPDRAAAPDRGIEDEASSEEADGVEAEDEVLPLPRTATIRVLMPNAESELVVRGAVGRGNPDEWYGPTRVIHTPPMSEEAPYLVGAFWLAEEGEPQQRSCPLTVEPGKSYEIDLRAAEPSWKALE